MTRNAHLARALALGLPLALLLGALGSQYLGGLYPCEMCHWQRWPHYLAVVVAACAFLPVAGRVRNGLIVLAALAIAVSGAIGLFHAGVEYHWWHGFTACTASTDLAGATAADRLAAILAKPVIPCDIAQWRLAGISLAGFNAILSLGGAAIILVLMRRAR